MKTRYTVFQIVLERCAFLILVLSFAFLVGIYGKLPEVIPTHWDLAGKIDSYGDKTSIWFLAAIDLFLYVLLSAVTFFPKSWNVPGKVTDENCYFIYHNTKSMLISMKLCVVIMMTVILIESISSLELGGLFLPLSMVLVFAPMIYYLIKMHVKNPSR